MEGFFLHLNDYFWESKIILVKFNKKKKYYDNRKIKKRTPANRRTFVNWRFII
ncbi:hypothetical protein FLAVO9R_20010 [Flavobacterium sp. 9R]|nr:hypothetical protein FLAVO9R_20010 [Flavobacterium sp. 9R]